MGTTMKLYPIGTTVCHESHGKGKIVGYNGQPRADIDKQINWLREGELDKLDGNAQSIIIAGAMGGFYPRDRYPYRIKFEPNEDFLKRHPECAEHYKDGYEDVYGPEGLWFTQDGETWVKYNWDGEIVQGKELHDTLLKQGIEVALD